MIYTQFNNAITIAEYDKAHGLVTVVRQSDGKVRHFPIDTLKADGGLTEIVTACATAKPVVLK